MAHIIQIFSGDATQDDDYTKLQVITQNGSLYELRMDNNGNVTWVLVT